MLTLKAMQCFSTKPILNLRDYQPFYQNVDTGILNMEKNVKSWTTIVHYFAVIVSIKTSKYI